MKSDSHAAQSVCGSISNAEGPGRAKHREASLHQTDMNTAKPLLRSIINLQLPANIS